MKFVDPHWLYGLVLLPLIYLCFLYDAKFRKASFERFSTSNLWSKIAPEIGWKERNRKTVTWVAIAAFILIALARPQWGKKEEKLTITGLDVVLALDVSSSMMVEDVVPNRLRKAKHVIRSLVDSLSGDRVGVVAFAGSSFLASPLTTDLDYIKEVVDGLNPSMIANQGTDLGLALETAYRAMERGAEDLRPVSSEHQPVSKVVILFTDGEDLEGGGKEGAALLKKMGASLYVLGVGTEKGGPIPVRDQNGELRTFKKHGKGADTVISQFKPDTLIQVAQSAGGRYWTMTPGESEVDEVLSDLGSKLRADYAERTFVVYTERFQIPLFIAVLLLLLEFTMPARKIIRHSLVRSSIGLTFFVLASLFASDKASAKDSLDAYLENEKGIEAYKNDDLETARRHFGAAQAKEPNIGELLYNQGVVQMKENDAEGAIYGFSGAAKSAIEKNNPELAAKSFYNLGAALEKKNLDNGAVQSYLKAMENARKTGNKGLETASRQKIQALAQKVKQKKQNESKNDDKDDNKDNKKNDNKDGKDGKEKKNDQSKSGDEEKKENQKKEYSKGKKEKFKSEQLSKEDAERVMSELANKERELQQKLRRQKGLRRSQSGKDW